MAKLLFFLRSLLHAANSPLFALSPSLVVLHTHGLLATFISGATLSGLAMIEVLGWLALCVSLDSSVSSHQSHLVSLLASFILSCLIILSHLISCHFVLPYPICPAAFASFISSLRSLSSVMAAIHDLSIGAHLAGFQACYLPGSRMSFYPSLEQPKVSPHIKVIIDLWLTSAQAFQRSND